MRAPRSLQWRLSLWLGLVLALLWVAAALVTAQRLRREMNEVFDSALEETAQRILPLAVLDIIGREGDGASQSVATLRRHDEFLTYVVRDAKGMILLRSHGADEAAFPPFTQPGFVDTPTHRIYFDAALQGTITIAIAEPLAHRRAVAREAFLGLAWPLGLIVPVSLLAIWAIVRASMAPIRAVRKGIEARGSADLAPVAAAGVPSEMTPIVEAVNRLLDRLGRTLEAERSFTANSAHELRTPVAAALAQTQRLISETADPAARDRARQIEAALRRLSRLCEKLMHLARAEGGRLQTKQAADLAPVLGMIADEMRKGAHAPGRVEVSLPATPVLSNIDPDAFAILARNLIENALKHGAPDEPVRVCLSQGGTLAVVNGGAPVAKESLDHLAGPFVRGQTVAEGAGLGLAIAKAIAAGVGGKLTLTSPAPGRPDGFEARFDLGADPTPREASPRTSSG